MPAPHWTTLSHQGIALPEPYVPKGLSIKVLGKEVKLSPLAEEMAYHLAKKKDTQYIKDPVFANNFMGDLAEQLPEWCGKAKFEQVDFSSLFSLVDDEKKRKELMSKEQRKRLAARRKERKEELKSKFGHANVDGLDVEIANWMAEPPGLFMGRGEHPLRGSWKPRVEWSDVILNLDENAPVPPGNWKRVIHDHNSMWVAKWTDKLTKKEKYVWLHDSSHIQQSRNREKYDKAVRIERHLERVRARILKSMSSRDRKVAKIATVAYLIDKLGMRVGDEKNEDEADTVGATTLRVEHLKITENQVEFDFLGKDYVRWVKKVENPEPVLVKNIKQFIAGKGATEEIFDVVNSGMVNRFFSGILEGLTAKVFRTYHATAKVEDYLRAVDVSSADEPMKKYQARMANLEAAIFCNHKRTPPKNWEESLKKKEQKLAEYQAKGKEERINKIKLNIELAVKTRDYNLNTTLKSYIDPRVYKSWCDYVDLDWNELYTKSLQRKFSWAAKSRRPWKEQQVVPVPVISQKK